jgi:hypothetical protein
MHSRPKILNFVFPALLVGVCLGVLSRYSDAFVVKLSITLPLMAASGVDSQWIFSESWKGGVAFLLTLAVQWAVLGWIVFSGYSWIDRKKKRNSSP